MNGKKVNILNILVPVLLLFGAMISGLIKYPVIFDSSKLTIITDFGVAIAYVIIWMFLKPDRFSRNGGLIIGSLFIVNISLEEFINWQSKTTSLVATLTMMSVIFITFALISAVKTVKTGNLIYGLKSSFASALSGTIIDFALGF